jgi:hypothetical protein
MRTLTSDLPCCFDCAAADWQPTRRALRSSSALAGSECSEPHRPLAACRGHRVRSAARNSATRTAHALRRRVLSAATRGCISVLRFRWLRGLKFWCSLPAWRRNVLLQICALVVALWAEVGRLLAERSWRLGANGRACCDTDSALRRSAVTSIGPPGRDRFVGSVACSKNFRGVIL